MSRLLQLAAICVLIVLGACRSSKSAGPEPAPAFSKMADFGEMSERPVYLEQVLQNVTFEVNERGLRAESATAASFPPPSAPRTPTMIRVNRPFLFSLLNIRTGAVLFSGRYSGPSR